MRVSTPLLYSRDLEETHQINIDTTMRPLVDFAVSVSFGMTYYHTRVMVKHWFVENKQVTLWISFADYSFQKVQTVR